MTVWAFPRSDLQIKPTETPAVDALDRSVARRTPAPMTAEDVVVESLIFGHGRNVKKLQGLQCYKREEPTMTRSPFVTMQHF